MTLTDRWDVAAATLTAAVMGAGSVVAAAALLASEPSGVDQSLSGSRPPFASVSVTRPGPPAATRMAARRPTAVDAPRPATTRAATIRPMAAARTAAPPVKIVLEPDRFEVRTVLEPGKRPRAVDRTPASTGPSGEDETAWRRSTVGG